MSHTDRTTPDPRGLGQASRTTQYSTDGVGERPATSDDDYAATEDGGHHGAVAATPDRHDVVATEKERHGGVKVGSAFFGWLTAMGMAVILTALVAAAGTAVGLATGTTVDQATTDAASDPTTVGLVGIIALLVILFVAYYCGGYVAGRMARFDGAKQGVAVWLWALVAAVVVAALGAVAGAKFNVLANLNSFPRLPVNEGQMSTAWIIAAVVAAAAALLGAVLGGLAGMRFHRRVDRTALGD